jgi:hypothetical protein
MRAIIFFAIACGASAASIQEVVDKMFDQYLPQKATWEEVKKCRSKCNEDKDCLASCPKYQCPFQRISAQCDLFNSTMEATKACHHGCGHDFTCHVKCPMAMPTSMKEMKLLSEAMVCHKQCGHDHSCHKACHQAIDPWHEKHARCEKLEAVVACMKNGGSHSTCPHLDEETKKQLMQEPWSLPKDIMNHVVDSVLPIPQEQLASKEEIGACHMQCGHDHECHKNCPTGVFGRLKEQCNVLEESSACHQACAQTETKCPFKKMECHFKCPMSMPTSVTELKGLTDHVLCHTTCGQDKICHKSCPNSNWEEKKTQCVKYHEFVACHMGCGKTGPCLCQLQDEILNEAKKAPSDLAKEVIDVLLV